MTVPEFQKLMLPILNAVGDGRAVPRRELANAMIAEFRLTQAEQEQTVPSGAKVIDNRTWWAITHLFQAGLLARPERGIVEITDPGRAVLANPPARIDMAFLRDYPSYVEFRNRSKTKPEEGGEGDLENNATTVAPEELIQRAVDENRAAVESEVLERALSVDPTAFERLVLRLLEAMGYGKSGRIEHSGKSGDGGIDGIISQDPLGLDRVYMQAKRYARDNVVQRPAIQGFIGALFGAQGDRGVFITTSSFTAGARQEAEKVNARIVLIDGDRLAELMVRHGVGVQAESTAAAPRGRGLLRHTLRHPVTVELTLRCGCCLDGHRPRICSSLTPEGVIVSAHGPAPSFVSNRSSRVSCRVNMSANSAGEWSCLPPIQTERTPFSRYVSNSAGRLRMRLSRVRTIQPNSATIGIQTRS